MIARTLCVISMISAFASAQTAAPASHVNHAALKALSWQLAIPTDSFGSISLISAAHKAHELGVHHLELVFGQKLSDDSEVVLDESLDTEKAKDVVAQLKKVGLDIVVVRSNLAPKDAADAKHLFDLAAALNAKVVFLPAAQGISPEVQHALENSSLKLAVNRSARLPSVMNPRLGSCVDADSLDTKSADIHPTLLRVSDSPEHDSQAVQLLVGQHFAGVAVVQARQAGDEASLIKALDTFAAALAAVPTTQP